MDPVACSNYHNQPSVCIFVQQKGQNLACALWKREEITAKGSKMFNRWTLGLIP